MSYDIIMNTNLLEVLVKVASNNQYLIELHNNFDKNQELSEQIYDIYKFGKDLPNKIDEPFNPWIYVANYPETIDQFWNLESNNLNEVFVTYVYIIFGFINNLSRNQSNLTLYQAYDILKPKVILIIHGHCDNFFDQYIKCKSQIEYILNNINLVYPYFEIHVEKKLYMSEVFDRMATTLLKDYKLFIYETKEDINLKNNKCVIELDINTHLQANLSPLIFSNFNYIHDKLSITQNGNFQCIEINSDMNIIHF